MRENFFSRDSNFLYPNSVAGCAREDYIGEADFDTMDELMKKILRVAENSFGRPYRKRSKRHKIKSLVIAGFVILAPPSAYLVFEFGRAATEASLPLHRSEPSQDRNTLHLKAVPAALSK